MNMGMSRMCVPVLAVFLAASPVAASGGTTALQSGLAAYSAGEFAVARGQLRPLADRGSAIAETLLGVMALKGQGQGVDAATAVARWLRAAQRGYAPAQLALAKVLARGDGVAADPEAAWVWARLATTDPGVGASAGLLADRLASGISAPRLAVLEMRRARWRPWALQ